MLDRSIAFYNVIMRCDDFQTQEIALPPGYKVSSYRPGDEREWARLEHAIGDFDPVEEARSYFVNTYPHDPTQRGRILFLRDSQDQVIGSCIAWRDRRQDTWVASLHWLVVDSQHQGRGLGRALCLATMNEFAQRGVLPVYLHTQPWSWKAILLYLSVGFKLQKTDAFASYGNEYDNAMATLKTIVTADQYGLMCELSEE